MRELESLREVRTQLSGIEVISNRLDAIDLRFGEQAGTLEKVQEKINLAMTAIGEVRQEQVAAARTAKAKQSPVSLKQEDGSIMGQRPPQPPQPLPPQPPPSQPVFSPMVSPRSGSSQVAYQFDTGRSHEDHSRRRQWAPKMDFPKFDGTNAKIWLDGCEAYFTLYDIPGIQSYVGYSEHGR